MTMKKKLPTASSNEIIPEGYKALLETLKSRIHSSQAKAIIKVNEELIKLYWEIGREIVERQEKEAWGSQVIERLPKDLQTFFPGIGGFSRANVFKMRAFYLSCIKVSKAVRQIEELPFFRIPWGHNVVLLTKIKEDSHRLWYAEQTLLNGWTRSSLEDWIKSELVNRQGKAVTNFAEKLPAPHSRLAHETLKDPYNFDFLSLAEVDVRLKHPSDNSSIRMILCKTKNNFTVEYALRDIHKLMGVVAGYETKIMESLPQNLKGSLPTVEEFEAELTKDEDK